MITFFMESKLPHGPGMQFPSQKHISSYCLYVTSLVKTGKHFFPAVNCRQYFLPYAYIILSSWLTKVHQPNETDSKRSDEDENIPPSPPTQQTNNGWLILFPPTMLNWLENIRSGNKTLLFKVNILPSDIENNCLSWMKVLQQGASFVTIQYSESSGLMLIGRYWMEDALLLVVPEKLLWSAAFFNDEYYT